ncbi:cytochrome P450 [Amycolatopsis sp. MEPSY49]|uniref:cytochrome P450 n=1 Tax=Amycolatopsis sp. MEPSY49 TaxID=3151600 RepID=UPI003EF825FB
MTDFADRWGLNPEHFWLRGKQPEQIVRHDEKLGVWHVYGYPEAVEILGDPVTFASDSSYLLPDADDKAEYAAGDLLQMAEPEHGNLRKQVGHVFSPKAVADLESRITKLAHELIDELAGREAIDLVTDFADPLSGTLFCELLGIPTDDRELFKLVQKSIDSPVQLSTLEQGEDQESYLEAQLAHLQPLRDRLTEHIVERRARPRDDLLSLLIRLRKLDGTGLDDTEALNFAIIMLGAGHLTSTVLIGNTALLFDEFPEQAARVRENRALVPSAIDESLRFLTPAAATYRASTTEVTIGGTRVPKDQMLQVWFACANRDKRQFTHPEVFDPARDPNPHLGFGRGIHYCLGAHMARMEGRIVFDILLDRFPVLRTDPDNPPKFYGAPDFVGLHSLPVLTA